MESWWLVLIPIIFALGWIAARVDIRQMLSESKQLPDSYFKGLNFLLNEDHDKAIDAFVEVAKLDTETTELHFALGNLFRRRGEMERAIRVHQSLLNRADLPRQDQEKALHEIGQDFFKAGMFDRAEDAYKKVLNTSYALSANRALLRIYEAEHDWFKAIESVQQLKQLTQEPVPQLIHYYCELAEAALLAKEPQLKEAQKHLDNADNAYKTIKHTTKTSLVRILLLKAQYEALQENWQKERLFLEQIYTQAPDFGGLVANQFLKNADQLGEAKKSIEYLIQHYKKYPNLDLFNTIFKTLRFEVGAEPAWEFAQVSLKTYPSLLGLDKLLEIELKQQQSKDSTEPLNTPFINPEIDVPLMHKMLHKHTQRLDRYACQSCGFLARAYYWQCPGCNHWESYSTKRIEEI